MLIDTIALELYSHTEQWKEQGHLFLHDDFFMLREFGFASREFLVPSQPYLLRDGRVVLVRQGMARYTFNLVEYEFVAGDLVVFFGDTLIEKRSLSPDFQLDAFSFHPSSRNEELRTKKNEDTLDGKSMAQVDSSFFILHSSSKKDSTRSIIDQHFALMWSLAQQQPFPDENVRMQVESLLHFVRLQQAENTATKPANHQEETLRRFISLVSRHASSERAIPFYADRLCIAPHYLSTLIKQLSGKTVMQWVNQTVVKEIKVWLAYSDETAAQIADRLNFPHPSSLTKFFKRETGLTPTEYRQGIGGITEA